MVRAADPPANDIGAIVASRFRIESPIARGSASRVFRAIDLSNGRAVALKLVADGDRNARKRFLREVEALSGVRHPGVVRILAYGAQLGEGTYIAMELAIGLPLRRLLGRRPRLSPREGVAMLGSVASALDAMHRAGLVHRDVCPENVVVDGNDAKLVDFGAAFPWEGKGERITAPGSLVGSPTYLPPEAAAGAIATQAWDLYSLATILFEIIAGAPPFPGVGLDVLLAKAKRSAPSLGSVHGGLVSVPVELVLQKALARDPNERQTSATGLLLELDEALGESR